MTSQLYENLFLVDNIPEIEGNQKVKNMIKKYAYTSEMYMVLARKFSLKFILVLEAIEKAYTRKNPTNCKCCREERENDIHEEIWTFMFDHTVEIINDVKIYYTESLSIKAKNCYICGDYIYSNTSISNVPFCNCDRES